jgi:pyruvate/2-oxoglutarate dehydrogenase complex dihydrolipoamide acyltransferase (E2) component
MMDSGALRMWGIIAGSVVLAGSLLIGFGGREPAAPTPQAPPAVSAPQPEGPAPQSVFEPAAAQQPPPAAAAPVQGDPVSFLVRFRGSGPLAQAQNLAERGRTSQGAAAARRALSRQGSFAGLCFDRFTVGGAEMVLRTCDGVARAERQRTTDRWLSRLRTMRGVAYADVNAAAATQER